MNLFCGNLEELFKKYQVYSVPTMGMDDFMVVSGMPSVLGKHFDDDSIMMIMMMMVNGVVGKHGKQDDDDDDDDYDYDDDDDDGVVGKHEKQMDPKTIVVTFHCSGDKHVSEIASMAFDLLAGFVVLQVFFCLIFVLIFFIDIFPPADSSPAELEA